jgi:hypothetical protein
MARLEGRDCAQIFLFFFRRPITSLFYPEFHCLNASLMILELRFDVFQLLSFKFCHVCVLFFFLLTCGRCSTFSNVLAILFEAEPVADRCAFMQRCDWGHIRLSRRDNVFPPLFILRGTGWYSFYQDRNVDLGSTT